MKLSLQKLNFDKYKKIHSYTHKSAMPAWVSTWSTGIMQVTMKDLFHYPKPISVKIPSVRPV